MLFWKISPQQQLDGCKAAVTSASAWLVAQAITGCKLLAVPFSQRALPSLDSCYFCTLSRAVLRVRICFPQGAGCVSIQVQSTGGLEPFSPFLQREEPLLGVAVLCSRGLTPPRVGFRAFAFQNMRGKGEPTRAHSSVPGRGLEVHGAEPNAGALPPSCLDPNCQTSSQLPAMSTKYISKNRPAAVSWLFAGLFITRALASCPGLCLPPGRPVL